jgi:D-alanyl-D-alanine carboxypeptidase
MKTGFICASGFNLVASATRNGKKLIAVVLGAKSGPYRGAKAAGLLERGFNRSALSLLTPSLGSVEQLQPVNVAPPDLRDEMCGPHRKRPAAETADDETSEAFSLSSLPAGVKPSSLVKERPGAVKAVAVYLGPAKKSAETQFADARTKVGKLAKGKAGTNAAMNRDPHTAPLDPAPGSAAATAAVATAPAAAKPTVLPAQTQAQAPIHAPTPALQTAAIPPPGVFAPPPSQPGRTTRSMPGASDVHNPSLMSFAPSAARAAEVAPLTATPDAKAGKFADVPLPRRRPKLATATASAAPNSTTQKRAATGH